MAKKTPNVKSPPPTPDPLPPPARTKAKAPNPFGTPENLLAVEAVLEDLKTGIPTFFAIGAIIFLLNWLLNRYLSTLIRFSIKITTNFINLFELLLDKFSFVLYYLTLLTFILLSIITFFSLVTFSLIHSNWSQAILLPIYYRIGQPTVLTIYHQALAHPKSFLLGISTLLHSPLLIIHRYLPLWLSIPLYFLLLLRIVGNAFFRWKGFDFIFVPIVFMCGWIVLFIMRVLRIWESPEEKQLREKKAEILKAKQARAWMYSEGQKASAKEETEEGVEGEEEEERQEAKELGDPELVAEMIWTTSRISFEGCHHEGEKRQQTFWGWSDEEYKVFLNRTKDFEWFNQDLRSSVWEFQKVLGHIQGAEEVIAVLKRQDTVGREKDGIKRKNEKFREMMMKALEEEKEKGLKEERERLEKKKKKTPKGK